MPRRVRLPAIVAGVLALVIVGEAIALAATKDDVTLPTAPDATVDLTHDFAVAVTSFDYKTIDADIARVLAFGTATFENDFLAAMGADFVETIVANKRVSVGEVVAGPTVQTVERPSAGRARLLVVVDQQVTSEGSDQQPQMVRVGLLVEAETGAEPKVFGVRVL